MDEKQLKALWESMSATHELGNFDGFKKNIYSDSNFRKGFWQEAAPQYEIGDYKTFEDSFKKKVPPQPSQSSAISSQLKENKKDNRFLDFGQTESPKVSEEVKRAERLGAKPYVATKSNLPDIGEAINNAVEQKNKEYRAKGGTKLPSYVKDQVIESVKNGDLVPVNENGKSVLKRGAGFFEIFDIFSDAVQQNHVQNLENSYIATLPKDKAISYLNTKMASLETFENKREFAPSGFFGKVGEFLGENIPMLTKATTGAIGGTALAPETGGASFGMFLANAKDMANAGYAQNLEKNYRGIKEQHPEFSDSEAYDKANKAALVGEVTSLTTNAVFSYAAPKNIQLPSPTVETTGFINSLTHAIKSYPKVGATAAAGSVINDIASNLSGNKIEAEQIGENAVESAKEMAVMHFGLWALGQPFKIPSYLRPQAENIVASAPREEVKQFYKGMEERGVFPEGTADKVVDKLNEFEEQKQVVNGMDLNEEQKASITGKLLQRKKIEEENKELKKYGNSFNARIENNDKAISNLDSEIDGIVKTGKVEKFEKDNLTGQTPTEIGKAVEEQIKPIEEPKAEEVKPTEIKAEPTKTLTNKEKVKQLRAEEQAEYDAMPNQKDEVKKKEIYDRYDKLITPLLKAEKKETEIGGGIKNNTKDSDFVLPINEVDNLRKQKPTNLVTANAIELDSKINKEGLKESAVITYYPNEGVAELTDGHTRLDVLKDNGARNIPIRVVEKFTDAPKSAKEWNPPSKTLKEQPIIDAHKKADEYISEAQDAYDKAQAKRLEYIKKNGYPTGNDPEFDKLVSAKVDAEDKLNRLKKAKDNLLPLPKVEEAKPKEEIAKEVKKEEVLPKEEAKVQESPIIEGIVDGKKKNVDLSKGKKAEIPKDMVFKDEKEHDRFVVDNSENPSEIANIYVSQPKTYNLSSVEMMIAEFGIGKIKFSSYKEFGDKNNMNLSKAKAYINKNGRTLDVIAKEISDHYDYEITPGELIDFIDKFPNGESSALSKKNMAGNDISFDAQQKFFKLTGLKLNDKIAEKAINYEFEKLNKEQKKLTYEQWKSEKELTDAYWKAYRETDGFTKESNPNKAEQPKPTNEERAKSRIAPPKENIAAKARDLAEKIRSGEKQILPDWLKADLPKDAKLSGISFQEAAAKALETFADVYEKVNDVAKAISEALVHLKDWHNENNLPFDEKEWARKFEENVAAKEKTKKEAPEERKVGVSHEALKKLAKKLGLKEPVRGQRDTPEEMANRGRLLYNAGADVEQIAKDFKDGMQPTADDISIVRAHIEDLAKIADEMYAKWGNGRQYTEAKQELSKWQVVAKEMGTKASEPFTALQGERDLDSDSFTVVKGSVEEKMEKLGGINAKQEKKIIELTEQNKKLKEQAKKAEKAAIEAANKAFGGKGGKESAEVSFSEKAKKVADNFRKLKNKEFVFRDENGNEIQLNKAGVSWNELIELGAKTIEKTGEIADGVAEIINNIKDKEWYQKLSDKDKTNLEKQFTKQFEDAVEETPEAKLIRRLQNELENIQRGIVKQNGVKIEDTPEIKELRDEIFEAKKNLGLIKGKPTLEPKTKISEEQKIINRLERELKDLEQGLVKQKAEKFKDTSAIKELKDKIFEQKQKLGLIPSKGKVEEYAYGLTETPESRNLKRLEKELDNLRQGILKEPPNKRELSNAEKELKDKIFEQKQMMGLIPSKNVKDTDYGLEITLEEKKIERLEKEKEDLENGIIKQKNVNNLNPTPEQQEKINKLKEEISGLKENLGLIKSKQEKPLTEEEQIELKEKRKEEIIDLLDKNVLRDLKNPKNMFSIEEKKAIWKYAKEEYLDKGVEYKDMISLVAEDLGLTWSQMNYAITTTETKRISDEMWIKNSNYKKNQNATKRWVEEQGKNEYAKLLKRISDKIRGISVFGHGGIFVGTHAMMTLFDPLTWKQTVPAFFRAWRYAYGNKANYEIAMQELKNRNNYNMAQRSGLKNNPDVINAEEFQKSQNFLGKLGGAGEQGFNAIKVLRQDLFDYHWNKLTESEKLDLDDKGVPMAAKEISWLINNSTGATNLKVPEWLNEATFAGGMEMARWAKLTRNPLRASEIAVRALVNPKKASSSERVFAKVWASRVGRQLGFMASALAVNYAMQNAINPKNKVNISNPKENDFGKFKFGDINIDATSGMLGVTNFIKSLVFISTEELEELNGDTRMEATGKKSIQYLRGKLAPFYQKVSDFAFNTDFSGNVLPYSSDKPRQGKHKLGWFEYLSQAAPLPIAEAAHVMYESAAEHGGDPKIVDALVMAAISGGTGAKPSLFKEKQLQFSEEDKAKEPFKFFVNKGIEFKELNPYKIEIEDDELSIKKPLDEFPKETIDNFKKIHKEKLTESLDKIQEKGYVYIDKFGNLSISRGEGKPKEKIDLTELNKDQLKKIVSLLNSDATDKTKKEVFNQ